MIREASLEPGADRLPGFVWQAGPFAMLAAVAAWLAARWNELPERLPVHWNVHGEVDRMVARTVPGVALPLFIGAGLCALLLAIQVGIVYAAPRQPLKRATLFIVLGGEYISALACCAAVVAVATAGKVVFPAMAVALVGALALIAASYVTLRRQPRGGDRNPEKWRGPFYANKDDPALFVPKKYGYGYTVNFGHRLALPLLVVTLALPLVVVAVVLTSR